MKRLAALFNGKKYLLRIFLFIILVTLVMIIISSINMYFQIEKMAINNLSDKDEAVMLHMKYYMSQMLNNILKISLGLFYDQDVQSLMYSENSDDVVDILNKIESINKVIITNNFIHSVAVYNHKIDKYFYSHQSLYFEDRELINLIDSYEIVPRLVFLPRKFKPFYATDDADLVDVISIIMYDSTDQNGKLLGALIINVDISWLSDSIEILDKVNHDSSVSIYIARENGEIFWKTENNLILDSEIRDYIGNYHKSNSHEIPFLKQTNINLADKAYLTTFISIEGADLYIYKFEPYRNITSQINEIRFQVILTTLFFLIISIISTITISYIIYSPVNKLITNISRLSPDNLDYRGKGEFGLLNNLYKKHISELNMYKIKELTYAKIINNYYLHKILSSSYYITKDEWNQIDKQNMPISFNKPMRLAVIKIYKNKFFGSQNNGAPYSLQFKISQFAREQLSAQTACVTVDMNEDHIIIISNTNYKNALQLEYENILNDLQAKLLQQLNFSSSITYSDIIKSKYAITKHYNSTLDNSNYSYIFAFQSIINQSRVSEYENQSAVYDSMPKEKELVEAIKCGQIEIAENIVNDILKNVSKQRIQNVMISTSHFIDIITQTITDVNKMKLQPLSVNINQIKNRLHRCECISDLEDEIINVLHETIGNMTIKLNDKYKLFVDTVKEIISNNYSDSSLYIQGIASMMKISAAHLSKIFKSVTNIKLSEYINDFRLNEAAQLLEKTNLSITDISLKVGIENRSYFFRVFKKKFGITPKEYSMKTASDKILK